MTMNNFESGLTSIESSIRGDGWQIKELYTYNGFKSYELKMDNNTDRVLTPDNIKDIIENKYNYCRESLSLIRDDHTNFDSGICKAGDIIRIYVDLSMNEDTAIIRKSDNVDKYRFDNVRFESKGKSIYKDMIENQNGMIRYGDKNRPELTLTIDDGNKHEHVEAILDMLKEENIQATFFVKGDRLESNKDLWQRAIKEGHQICCHTYSHYYLNSKGNITSLTTGLNKEDHPDVNVWVNNVKRLLGEKDYKEIEVSERRKGIDFPKSVSSDVLLKTEILMREEEVRRTLGEEYLERYKKDFPFIRLPGGHGMMVTEQNKSVREKNVKVLKDMGYLSIIWSDDFIRSGSHQDINHMAVENGGTPLFHFRGEKEQGYIKQYIKKAKKMGKKFKPLSDIIKPTN